MLSMNDPVAYYNPFGFSPIVKIGMTTFVSTVEALRMKSTALHTMGKTTLTIFKYSCDCAGWYAYKEAWKSHCALKNEVVPKIKALYDELRKKHPRLSKNEILCQSEINYIKKKYGV